MAGRTGSKFLTEKSFNLILTLKEAGLPNKQIREIAKCSDASIWRVNTCKTWEAFKVYKDGETVKRDALKKAKRVQAHETALEMFPKLATEVPIEAKHDLAWNTDDITSLLININDVLHSLDKRCEIIENNATLAKKKGLFR